MPEAKRVRSLGRSSIFVAAALVAGTGLAIVPATAAMAGPQPSICPDASGALFGPNVCVFTPTMTQSAIQGDLNAIATQQVPIGSQFDSDRYAILFQPGTYGSSADPLVFQVGYYTEVAGLGFMPQDTVINGAIEVFNNLCTAGTSNCNSDDNFWRSLSNLTLNVDLPSSTPAYAPPVMDAYGAGCANTAEFWAASQAAPVRRAIINGSLVYQDYCSADNYVSGGFLADSQVTGDLDFYGDQQSFARESTIGGTNGCPQGLWNMVYSGVVGAPAPVFTGQCEQNTVVAATPVTEEEPFLYTTAQGSWEVFVPAVQDSSSGPSWASGTEAGSSVPLSSFFIANPSTSPLAIDVANALGKDILLTPGVYDLSSPIVISHPDSVVVSLGFATLVPTDGNADMVMLPNNGVKLAGGIIFDAGAINSAFLLEAGNSLTSSNPADPDLFSDVFFRVGGAESPAAAGISFLDEAPNSIIDDMWAWRADHGQNANSTGWTVNTGSTGLIVDANNVNAYGLAVEHYQQNEVIWDGQGGSVEFFQNELPYDAPTQAAWMETPTQDGYPAFLVTPNVTSFKGYGMGSYVVFIDTPATLYDAEPFEAPTTPGVQFNDIFTVWIAGSGGDQSVIDGTGGPDTSANPGTVIPVDLASYS
jgi:hypothetical protein